MPLFYMFLNEAIYFGEQRDYETALACINNALAVREINVRALHELLDARDELIIKLKGL